MKENERRVRNEADTHTRTHTKLTFRNAGEKKLKIREDSRVYARNTTAVGDQRKRKSAPQKERLSDVFWEDGGEKKKKRNEKQLC